MKYNCIPFYCHLEFCIECDKVTPFDEWQCIYCGCDTPFGVWADDDRTYEEDEEYFKQRVRIGDLREASKDIQDIFDKYYPINH
ncbi:hypothetical protein [Chryseobacterium sp. MYb328]|uniref:hypothetical protein n=1 Tax=Chryseobacterium sp. MYb328 TaxID=2745231 RepID=UPI0030B4088E